MSSKDRQLASTNSESPKTNTKSANSPQDTNQSIDERIRNCFKRTKIQDEGDTELFDTELTIELLKQLLATEVIRELDGLLINIPPNINEYAQKIHDRLAHWNKIANKED